VSNHRKRLKASDVYKQTDFFFSGPKLTFAQAFPEIEDLQVAVKETDQSYVPHTLVCESAYCRTNPPGEYVDCRNPDCYNGGFRMGDILREMVQQMRTDFTTTLSCQGYEGSPNGRRKYDRCYHVFEVSIRLAYRTSQEQR
jgi:hypothetical protein